MEKQKQKKLSFLVWAGISVGILGIVYVTFSSSFNRVYGLLLEKDLVQTEFTSKYVTKLIETELENVMADLQVSQGVFLKRKNEDLVQMTERLSLLRTELKFENLGICDLEGEGVDWEGKPVYLEDLELLGVVSQGRSYISNVVDGLDTICLAVPIVREQETVGVLWGYYQVERIAETIELDANSHRYFQIVDDSGNYISDSQNVNSFARDENIWEEIAKYQLSGGMTVGKIRQDVEEGRSGAFHFTYHGAGRYVNYEPMGVNNWYVFSVLTEDYVTGYVKEVEEIFSGLLWGILICIAVFLIFIGKEVYRTTALIREKNATLTSRNSLLFMVLKHTNDIPFEVDLAHRSVTLYHMNGQEQAVTGRLEEYFPDELLKKQVIDKENYETYKRIFNNMINRRRMEPEILRICIDGVWIWNKIHYNVIGQDQLVGFLENYDEQVCQHEKMQEINRKSQLDPLTSLYNRAYFKHEVEKALGKRSFFRDPGYSALFLLDLDYFKQANDTLGHMVGDEILKESAMAMRHSVRSTDLCGRLGGDEFVLFIENVRDMEAIQRCAGKLNAALRRTYGTGERRIDISASIGIAVLTEETGFNELYRLADVALYRVKNSGRDGFYVISKDTEKEKGECHETESKDQE